MSWDSRFALPIELPDGVILATLREAIKHLAKTVPEPDHDMRSVLNAADIITQAAEDGGPVELARIATMQAINRHVERSFNPDRKEPHWRRPKLRRDR